MDDFREMLQNFSAQPFSRLSSVRAELDQLLQRKELAYVCVIVGIGLLASMNCSILLSLSVPSPRLWLDILSVPNSNVYVA